MVGFEIEMVQILHVQNLEDYATVRKTIFQNNHDKQ